MQRTNCLLTTRAWALDAHFKVTYAHVTSRTTGVLRRDLGSKWRTLSRALESLTTGCCPRQRVAVTISERGTPTELPASLGLTAYRIVQESLTNTLKHADAPTARVILDWRPNELDIVVEDDGTVAAARNESGAGKGLIGMRERVAAFGGDFSADPRLGGGWRVRARLPFDDALSREAKE